MNKQGNHWSIVQKPVDKIRHQEAKKFAKIEDAKIKELAKESAKNAKGE